jgi:hypothetical protein
VGEFEDATTNVFIISRHTDEMCLHRVVVSRSPNPSFVLNEEGGVYLVPSLQFVSDD